MEVSIAVNGETHRRDVEPRLLLVDFVRDHLGLKGTNLGCDTSTCGACTVHLDGRAVKSCTVLTVQADGAEVATVESLDASGALHPMQAAFHDHHGLQCGYCTPGMLMAAIQLVETAEGSLDERAVREGLDGNLCRCTGYEKIVDAVLAGAERMRGGAPAGAGGEV